MHGDRNKFQAQTLRGVRAGQGPSAFRESHGMAWQEKGSAWAAMGLV